VLRRRSLIPVLHIHPRQTHIKLPVLRKRPLAVHVHARVPDPLRGEQDPRGDVRQGVDRHPLLPSGVLQEGRGGRVLGAAEEGVVLVRAGEAEAVAEADGTV
jgi:hypothetical protein